MNWRHHVVSVAGVLALALLSALTWYSMQRQQTRAAPLDGFLIVRHANGTPAVNARVVVLRGSGVRWVRDTDAEGVVPFKRSSDRAEVVLRMADGWFFGTTVNLREPFLDVDLPAVPPATNPGRRIAGNWSWDDLPAAVQGALAD